MADPTVNLQTLGGNYAISSAYRQTSCPHCGGVQAALIGTAGSIDWYRCATCLFGFVANDGVISPSTRPLRTPQGLPSLDAAIWEEARSCLGVGANAAAVMLCRKLLFHIAVANGLAAKNNRDRSPTFTEAVDHLQAEELITKHMRPWVDRIKDVGNDANHELEPISPDVAMYVAKLTEQLLTLTYEMNAVLRAADPES